MRALLAVLALLIVGLSGCFGFDPADGASSFVPGEDWKKTGKTVHLKASVADWVFHEIYPGFHANLWAFCFEPADPNDKYSADAIEYWNHLETDGFNSGEFQVTDGTCSVPGPTLRVKQGDLVKVDFQNQHFHCHTIHWHGQHVPWQHDGAPGVNQESVCSGESFSYEFYAARAGSLWYHCHVDTHFHVMQGLYGAMIVEPQDDRWEPEDIDEEYVLIYSTLSRDLVQATKARVEDPHADHKAMANGCGETGKQGCQNPPVDVTPDTWMLNGRSLPYTMDDDKSMVRVDPGERVRLRLFNFGETMETIHTHGHDMLVTHRDGNPIPPAARFWVDTITIGTAERYDVLIEANNPGLWMMHTHIDHQATNDHMAPGGAMGMIVYRNVEAEQGSMHPYAHGAELTGGLPHVEPLLIPPDVYETDVFAQASAGPVPFDPAAVSGSLGLDIVLPCAVRGTTLVGQWHGDLPDGIAMPQGITLALTDGDGRVVLDPTAFDEAGKLRVDLSPLTDKRQVDWRAGNFTATLDGEVVGTGSISLQAFVDYFEDEDGLYANNRALGGTGCDPADRVFDPVAYARANGYL